MSVDIYLIMKLNIILLNIIFYCVLRLVLVYLTKRPIFVFVFNFRRMLLRRRQSDACPRRIWRHLERKVANWNIGFENEWKVVNWNIGFENEWKAFDWKIRFENTRKVFRPEMESSPSSETQIVKPKLNFWSNMSA